MYINKTRGREREGVGGGGGRGELEGEERLVSEVMQENRGTEAYIELLIVGQLGATQTSADVGHLVESCSVPQPSTLAATQPLHALSPLSAFLSAPRSIMRKRAGEDSSDVFVCLFSSG